MLLEEERNLVVEYGKKMLDKGLTTGSGGNVSIYNRESGLVALSPSSMDYYETQPEDVVIMDCSGKIVDGKRRPSTEINMHLALYRARDDISAVVHTHSLYATAVACMRWDLPAVHYLAAFGGDIIKCSEYATYGTEELAQYALEAMGNRNACHLGNHGLLAASSNIEKTFSTAEHL
ncbi:MAG: class II aldolase/adducin family protein, partial [Hydrogenoanaerobacterium sp.]